MLEGRMGYVPNSSVASVLLAGSSCHAPRSNLTGPRGFFPVLVKV